MLPVQVRKQRNAVLREAFAEMAEAYQRPFTGTEVDVLWESTTRLDDNGWELTGLTGNYMRVNAVAPEPRWNQIDRVRLQEWTPQGFQAEIL